MEGFRHEAFLYAGDEEFLAGTVPFVRDAVERDEAVMVVVDGSKLDPLREELNGEAEQVVFADMREVGSNPARIIPAWKEFVSAHPGRKLRGIGEPIGPGRRHAELRECHRHEALLNLAFADAGGFWLMCPYDTESLDPEIVAEAEHSHPHLSGGTGRRVSPAWAGPEGATPPFAEPLPDPVTTPNDLHFDAHALPVLRRFVTGLARTAGLVESRVSDLLLAVNEVATNSILHGGGRGLLRVWREPDRVICEVHDLGVIEDPLAGRYLPETGMTSGHGLWIANQVCDLVQLRSFAHGSVVRVHMYV